MPEDFVRYNVASDMRESVSVRYERPQVNFVLFFFFTRQSTYMLLLFGMNFFSDGLVDCVSVKLKFGLWSQRAA